MTRGQLEKSLNLWEGREASYRAAWKRTSKKSPLRYARFKLLKNAVRMVDRRKAQLAALRPDGISDIGLKLIKSFEGFRSRPYRDAVGVWTIGYGETRGISRFTLPWTEKKAAQRLRTRVDHDFYPAVRPHVARRHLNQPQADALTSFAYNLGRSILDQTTSIGRALKSGTLQAVADAILLYDKAGSPPRPLPGLTRRRRAERALFLA